MSSVLSEAFFKPMVVLQLIVNVCDMHKYVVQSSLCTGSHIMWQTWLEVGGQFNTFLSISLLFFVEGGGQSLSKLDGGMAGFVPWIRH